MTAQKGGSTSVLTPAPTWDEWVATHPAETPEERHRRHSEWIKIHREWLHRRAEAMKNALWHVHELGLLMRLVDFADTRHELDSHACRPRVPEDCSPYCRACSTLREVDDAVLLAVRAQREADYA